MTEKERFPSETTVWRLLQAAHELQKWEGGVLGEAVVPPESAMLLGMGRVNQDFVQSVQDRLQLQSATVDLDATIVESHKREALPHYDGGRGYQPYIAVWMEKWRPATLRYRLLNLAGRIVEHARTLVLKLPWLGDLVEDYRRYRDRLWDNGPLKAAAAGAG